MCKVHGDGGKNALDEPVSKNKEIQAADSSALVSREIAIAAVRDRQGKTVAKKAVICAAKAITLLRKVKAMMLRISNGEKHEKVLRNNFLAKK